MSQRVPLLPKKTTWSVSGIRCKLWKRVVVPDAYNNWPCPSDIANELQEEISNQIQGNCKNCSSSSSSSSSTTNSLATFNLFLNSFDLELNEGLSVMNTSSSCFSLPSVPNGVLIKVHATDYWEDTNDPKYSGCGLSCAQSTPKMYLTTPPYNIVNSGPGKCNNFFNPFNLPPYFRKIHDKIICSSKKKIGVGEKIKVKLEYEVDYGVTLTCDNGSRETFRATRTFTKDIDTYYQLSLETTRREVRREEKYCCFGRIWKPGNKCW